MTRHKATLIPGRWSRECQQSFVLGPSDWPEKLKGARTIGPCAMPAFLSVLSHLEALVGYPGPGSCNEASAAMSVF